MKDQLEERCLSVVMPAYNEAATLAEVVSKVLALKHLLEIIIVDDGSKDNSQSVINSLAAEHPEIRHCRHERNLGKTAALRTGFAMTRGSVVIIQDADLETEPAEIPRVIQPIIDGEADVVYGSRFLERRIKGNGYLLHFIGNKFLTVVSNVLSGLTVTDMETCYKAFRGEIVRNMIIVSNGFGFEVESTAKIAKLKCRVKEVPVSYRGRSYEEGKKMHYRDGLQALWLLVKFNIFVSLRSSFQTIETTPTAPDASRDSSRALLVNSSAPELNENA
ncbi:MAG TPA: glycosyltransferase family 2 protein [Pyrinomonadaceae bacterium]|nr:glycosyltransferase family 2 protein [Pyrinomonadaceae bacterium]